MGHIPPGMVMKIRSYVAQMFSVIWRLTPFVLVVVLYWQDCPALAQAVAVAADVRLRCRFGTAGGTDQRRHGWVIWSQVAALSAAYLAAVVALCLLKHPEGAGVVAEIWRRAVVRLLGPSRPPGDR
ncbi:Uncharacterised protein [Mycobacteroides abscessus subsp. abscessus]|nr:Uncharacterised protein [Mycobacteroides abscessus subsp. abscessus]SIC95219.1 Uncharacterised protein [Mycobacteroides abscessus subsp. abscessus]SID21064.1 Uncharacterised protein [Mycobacteroides abscessus subsp. abscessus]SID49588.1 Uncharacterised protein [Mycobacteroides abscessus subsp. abscessus]SKV98421.1 Uncharacterised protein [Mycobacteroides abscessus subsp. abscessus]